MHSKSRRTDQASTEFDLPALRRFHDDPDGFNTEILGRPPYWSRQRELCQAVVKHGRVAVKSGNAVGKSYWLGGIVLWWACTRDDSLVITTAPSQAALGTVLWKEMRRAAARLESGPFANLVLIRTRSITASPFLLEVPSLHSSVLGISTNSVERLSGHHSGNLLVAVDEASGVDAQIWEAIDSLVPDRLVVIGNPLHCEGRFHELFQLASRERESEVPEDERIFITTIPSTESPHAGEERSPWGLATARWLREMRRLHGDGSSWWRGHIIAEFPTTSHDRLLPDDWVDRCGRPAGLLPWLIGDGGPRVIAVDLGAGVGRDCSVVLIRDDRGIIDLHVSNDIKVAGIADVTVAMANEYRVRHDRIIYDAGGIGSDMGHHLRCRGIHNTLPFHGSGSTRALNFTNTRTHCAWRLRHRLDPDRPSRPYQRMPPPTTFSIPRNEHWDRLTTELKSLRFRQEAGGKTALENKEEMSRRLGRSPDLCDALIMSFAMDGHHDD